MEYFVTPKDIEQLLQERFEELGVKIKYHYESTGAYCVHIDNPEILKELSLLEYITIEPVSRIKALDSIE